MIRLGSIPPDMHEMFIDDIFLARLKLLIVMGKAYLHGYPLGHYRHKAITSNALLIKSEAIDLGNLDTRDSAHFPTQKISDSEKMFYENVKALAEMALDFRPGEDTGMSKRKKLNSVLDNICESITFEDRLKDRKFLEVA
ncbi:MAG: hypothetical protein B6I22_07105 [Desulfobacteraceae bacterium 4572_123]|nr:MAG: hypothetical protein B6I22_07105 [Desulfobacteraceae bacterium 4572_123]